MQLSDQIIGDTETQSALAEVVALVGARDDYDSDAAIGAQVEDAPIVRLANTLLQSAIKEKASDIHIDPDRYGVVVRFRIDGVLHEVMKMPSYITQPLTRRYQVLADVILHRPNIPQQGRIGTRYADRVYDFRVSCLPTRFGQHLVLHTAYQSDLKTLDLNKLGFSAELQVSVENLLEQRRGFFLIVGGAGQGKTTTQYVMLNQMAKTGASLFAVADYYDYEHRDISQTILNPKIGYNTTEALASIAQLDADVIALDGCRDKSALKFALEMATESTMVMHTQVGATGINALRQLISNAGTEPYVAAETVCGVLVQTLGRRICTECKEYYEVPASDLRRFGHKVIDPNEMVQLARGRGCEACRNTGYKGRIGFYELMTMNAEMAEMIVRRAPLTDLKEAAKANGMKELREDGLVKVLHGITTPEEVLRAVPALSQPLS